MNLRKSKRFQRHALAAAVTLALAGAAHAQLASSTIKGQVAATQAGTVVTAVNTANGATYRTTTLADGSYVLTGLAPGSYEIRVGAQKSQAITLSIGETASVDLAVGAAQQVTIVGSLGLKDATNTESEMNSRYGTLAHDYVVSPTFLLSSRLAANRTLLAHPNVQAFLKAIAVAEGGGYDFRYGAVAGKRRFASQVFAFRHAELVARTLGPGTVHQFVKELAARFTRFADAQHPEIVVVFANQIRIDRREVGCQFVIHLAALNQLLRFAVDHQSHGTRGGCRCEHIG